jgi:uncharacterized membrane protein
MLAAATAVLPRGLLVASMMNQRRLMVSAFAMKLDIDFSSVYFCDFFGLAHYSILCPLVSSLFQKFFGYFDLAISMLSFSSFFTHFPRFS